MKKIIQYLNKKNGEIHCYFENEEQIKYSYGENNWEKIVKEADWVSKIAKELFDNSSKGKRIRVDYVKNKFKNEVILSSSNIMDQLEKLNLMKDDNFKNILEIKEFKPNKSNIFRYYFDRYFYKKMISNLKESNEKNPNDDFFEKYMHKTEFLLGNNLSKSLIELTKGEQKNNSKNMKIHFLNSKFNFSQFDAIEKALKNNTTVIKGPPGTGKTTTLLNLIITAFINNKSVLVSSKNNEAVNNIIKSLKKFNFDKFWFRFGKKSVIQNEMENTMTISLKKTRRK